jgi:hypothetical protein
MLRTQVVIRSDAARHEDPASENDAAVLYIGLGDQFDDDRRLVRRVAPALRLEVLAGSAFRLRP